MHNEADLKKHYAYEKRVGQQSRKKYYYGRAVVGTKTNETTNLLSYYPIMCHSTTYKILIAILTEQTYMHTYSINLVLNKRAVGGFCMNININCYLTVSVEIRTSAQLGLIIRKMFNST